MRYVPVAPMILAVLLATPALRASGAEPAEWDQARVTQIAQQLAKACDDWQTAVRDQGGADVAAGMSEAGFGIGQNTQLLGERSYALADDLKKGKGLDATQGAYRSLKEAVDDTEVQVRESELEEPTQASWTKVSDLFRQLSAYYGEKGSEE